MKTMLRARNIDSFNFWASVSALRSYTEHRQQRGDSFRRQLVYLFLWSWKKNKSAYSTRTGVLALAWTKNISISHSYTSCQIRLTVTRGQHSIIQTKETLSVWLFPRNHGCVHINIYIHSYFHKNLLNIKPQTQNCFLFVELKSENQQLDSLRKSQAEVTRSSILSLVELWDQESSHNSNRKSKELFIRACYGIKKERSLHSLGKVKGSYVFCALSSCPNHF